MGWKGLWWGVKDREVGEVFVVRTTLGFSRFELVGA